MTRRLIILEPSKVGNQHITLINPYLEAAVSAGAESVEFWCAPSLWRNVTEEIRNRVMHRPVPVIDPASRRFLVKIPLEVAVTTWAMMRMKRDDLLLVTCLFSPALYFFSWVCWLFPRRNVHVVLHGELEALRDMTISPKISGYGFWIRLFWRHCLPYRSPGLVVIDRFIRDELLALSGSRLDPGRVKVLTMPIKPAPTGPSASGAGAANAKPRVCFIGYRSRMKGFDLFERLASERAEFEWLAIGGGQVEDLSTGETRALDDLAAFRASVSACDVAIFPYTGGYDLSMSAAVLDALSEGVPVVASRRNCFVALSSEFGSDVVSCVEGEAGFNSALDRRLACPRSTRSAEFEAILGRSRFSQANLNREMRAFVEAGKRVAAR